MAAARRYAPGEQALVDRWTLGHAAMGVLYGSVTDAPWWLVALSAVGWEYLENPLKDEFPDFFPDAKHDTIANAAVDAVAVMVGYWIGRRYGRLT